MSGNIFKVDLEIIFPSRRYKDLLRRLKTFLSYCATVGIHQADGKKKVIRKYNTTTKNGKTIRHIAGKSHRMNVVKLAYQNEFGANILIKPKFITTNNITKRTIEHAPRLRTIRTTRTKMSSLRKKQGYYLTDKQGKFIAYFKVGKIIKIPPRPFITKTIKERNAKLQSAINNILLNIFTTKKYTARKAIHAIAKLVRLRIRQNVVFSTPKSHNLTKKIKGVNQPLIDEKYRLIKSIKYKVYQNCNVPASKGYKALEKETIKHIDKLLKTADQFNKITPKSETTTRIFSYKNFNPNAIQNSMPQSLFDDLYDNDSFT